MSQEDVEVIRKVCDAFVRDDLDQVMAHCDANVVYKPAQEAAAYGLDGVRASLERWTGDIERLELVAEEFLDVGNRVFVTIVVRGRGRSSGAEVSARFYEVFILRGGTILHWEEFTDRSPALEAAGLSD
jgi:ketosteroid isomerase-like protein